MGANKFPSHKQQGFILAATLWTLAIMFIVVGIFHSYVQQKLQVGMQAKAALQQRLDRHSTEQTVLYLIGSSRMTRSGLTFSQQLSAEFLDEDGLFNTNPVGDEIRMDGAEYQGLASARFSLQDLSGLLAINVDEPGDLSMMIAKFDPNPAINAQLIARLLDYTDLNELVSLSGAEREDYQRQRLPLPTNDFLRSETELYRVMSWGPWLDAHPQFRWQEWLSVRRDSVINLNTMPESLLVNYLGLQKDLAAQLVQERAANPFRDVEDFVRRTELLIELNEDKCRFFPSNELRLSLWNDGGGQAEVISLQLTPNGLFGPWQINYEYSVPRANENNQPATPPMVLEQTSLFGRPMGDDR